MSSSLEIAREPNASRLRAEKEMPAITDYDYEDSEIERDIIEGALVHRVLVCA